MNSTELDDSELSPLAAVNRKEFHYHPNGSAKIVWAWACGTTGVLVAMVGIVALHFASEQSATNERVARAITDLAVQVAALKATVESMERRQ